MAKLPCRLLRELSRLSRKGAKCGECGCVFNVDTGDGKVVAMFPEGDGGLAIYVLCSACGANYKKRGPTASRDARITALMSTHAPKGKAPAWIH